MPGHERINDVKRLPSDEVLAAGGKIVELASGDPVVPGSPEAKAIIERMRNGSSKGGSFRIGKSRSSLPQNRTEGYYEDYNRPQ